MRHVPEDEIHAYLDQALSRSQCIEIETHLAGCLLCQQERDAIAALRDRTTALLASAAPRQVSAPPYATLVARAQTRRERSWRRPGLWAASIAGALLAGWGLRTVLDPHGQPAAATVAVNSPAEAAVPRPPAPAVALPAQEGPSQDPTPVAPQPARAQWSDPSLRLASGGTLPPRHPEVPSPDAQPAALTLDDRWTIVSLDEAEDATGNLVPMVPDLPVVSIRMRGGDAQFRPLLLVTQQHPSGTLVHTIEGPVADVAAFVSSQLQPGLDVKSSEPSRSPPDYLEAADGVRRTSRVLAIVGRLSTDSLNTLAQGVILK